jgi:DNA polymerase III subunit delta
MKLRADQLEKTLRNGLAPFYLLSGDEPLQLGEAADAIRTAAKKSGYSHREIFDVGTGFDWNVLLQAVDSPSLFADRRILDLRLESGSPGRDGAKALLAITERPPSDAVVLISAGKLAAGAQKTCWFQALDRQGVVIQVWPLQGEQLLQWLERRLRSKGIRTDPAGVRLLATRVEGNLLAAAQEIEKLYVLQGPSTVDADTIADVVTDSARFDVFDLVDNALQGHLVSTDRMLGRIRAEGIAPAIVLWALTREIRILEQVAFGKSNGTSLNAAMRQTNVWEKRKPLITRAINRLSLTEISRLLVECVQADKIIKGLSQGDPWIALLQVSEGLAGIRNRASGNSDRNT